VNLLKKKKVSLLKKFRLMELTSLIEAKESQDTLKITSSSHIICIDKKDEVDEAKLFLEENSRSKF
jgi:ribosomal protein L7/L12